MVGQEDKRDQSIRTDLAFAARLSAIQRDLKVVGRFYYLDLVKGKPGYRKFIPPTTRRLARNLANTPQARRILPLLLEQFEAMQ